MWPWKEKKSKKKPCSHCMHETGRKLRQKNKHWNGCKEEPYYWSHYIEKKCCKCKHHMYKWVAKTSLTNVEEFIIVKPETKIEPVEQEMF